MIIRTLPLPGLLLVTPPRHSDERGFFSETWRADRMAEAGMTAVFVQDNHSRSKAAGVVRGLHCQVAPSAQGKLIRVTQGAIWNVVVDARRGSESFGKHVAVELSEENWAQLWVPSGFLNGFCTLTDETEVIYKVTAYYDPAAERGVAWDDPDLALPWPVPRERAIVSARDAALPSFKQCDRWF